MHVAAAPSSASTRAKREDLNGNSQSLSDKAKNRQPQNVTQALNNDPKGKAKVVEYNEGWQLLKKIVKSWLFPLSRNYIHSLPEGKTFSNATSTFHDNKALTETWDKIMHSFKDNLLNMPSFVNVLQRITSCEILVGSSLLTVASLELKRLPKQNSCIYVGSIVYLPQIGYLMCLSRRKLEVEVLQDLPDFEFVFASGTNDEEECFYRTSKTKELDAMLGDIHHKILDMERAILRDLEFRIVSSSSSLIKMAGLAAELDCLLAFTSIARECKYVRPNFSEENVLNIKNGRHPLQELVLDTFVPNDTDCSNTGHVNIVTGPNYSGKSVYVKQVALIAFLSHIGSFVPAEQATIGLFDRIFSGVACKHTITLQESTFMMDLHQVSIMLRNSTEKSLCILDEFGKGTLNTDGIGILCSTLEYFANSPRPPRVFACTHFSEVFDEFFLRKLKNIQFFTMSVLERSSANGGELQDIIFLYRLVPGQVLPSYGLHCAELAGVPRVILNRASEIVGLIQEGKSIERIRTNEMSSNDSYYKGLVEKLLSFDCKNGDLDSFLKDVFSFDTNAANSQ
ncbi:hypothetical protein L7F22_068649 [Adiantum nelumboides]|nr:hypothetical protein [Adiantum nelumboides]